MSVDGHGGDASEQRCRSDGNHGCFVCGARLRQSCGRTGALCRGKGEIREVVLMTSRTMFEAAEDRRESGCAAFPVGIEDRGVDGEPDGEGGACAWNR